MWLYYLLWVVSNWFARIGYHDPTLAFSNEGWQVIQWSFLNGFIGKEGRVFLITAFGVSIIGFGILGYIYLTKHIITEKEARDGGFPKSR